MKFKLIKKDDVSLEDKRIIENIFLENDSVTSMDAFDCCNEVLFLFDKDVIIGYCLYKFNLYLPYQGIYINQIALLKKYQHQGYGRKIYHYIESIYHQNLYAHVDILNHHSMKFHCHYGFYPVEILETTEHKKILLVKEGE